MSALRRGWLRPAALTVGGEGMSVAAACWIAERAYEGQVDANGEPCIVHAGRVAAGVPLAGSRLAPRAALGGVVAAVWGGVGALMLMSASSADTGSRSS